MSAHGQRVLVPTQLQSPLQYQAVMPSRSKDHPARQGKLNTAILSPEHIPPRARSRCTTQKFLRKHHPLVSKAKRARNAPKMENKGTPHHHSCTGAIGVTIPQFGEVASRLRARMGELPPRAPAERAVPCYYWFKSNNQGSQSRFT